MLGQFPQQGAQKDISWNVPGLQVKICSLLQPLSGIWQITMSHCSVILSTDHKTKADSKRALPLHQWLQPYFLESVALPEAE